MDNVYSGHWYTDWNRAKYITMSNKKVNSKDSDMHVGIFSRSNHLTFALISKPYYGPATGTTESALVFVLLTT